MTPGPSIERAPSEPCAGCGASYPKSDGPTHPYIGASAGCWAVYGEVLAREYGEFAYPPIHRLTVDAYATQHPGTPSRRSIQSVAIHLISLHLVLERGLEARAATEAIGRAVRRGGFVWLEPPASRGELAILDVRDAVDLPDHVRRVESWARSVWSAWSFHADRVRRWAGADPTRG